MESKYQRLANNSAWILIGNMGSKILGFLLLPLYTRWLGTAGFGESDLVTTYSTFLLCIMTMCVSEAIFIFTKNASIEEKKIYFSTSLFFIIGILGVWMLIWGGLNLAFSIHNIKNSFADNIWLIYGIVVTTFLQQYCQQFILSIERIKLYSLTGIIHTTLTFVSSYCMIPAMGVRGYILSIVLSNLLTALFCFVLSCSFSYLSLRHIRVQTIKEVLKYSIPLIPNGAMWWIVSALNRPFMEYHLDYSSIGIFAVASRFPAVITMVFSVFSVAWNISVFEEYKQSDYKEFYYKTFRFLFLVIISVAFLVITFSRQVIELFVAPEFMEAWQYMIILIIGSVFSCMSGFFGTNFSVEKKSKYFFYSSLWGALTATIANFVLIPYFGLWGASFSTLLSFLVMMVSRYIYSLKFIKIAFASEITKYTLILVVVSLISLYISNPIVKFVMVIACFSVFIHNSYDIIKPLFRLKISDILK